MAMNVFKEAGMSYQGNCLLAGTLALLGLVFAYLFDRAKRQLDECLQECSFCRSRRSQQKYDPVSFMRKPG